MLIYLSEQQLFEHATTIIPVASTITITQSVHLLDTEAGASISEISTINGTVTDNLLFLRITDNCRKIVLKHLIGNIYLQNEDLLLDSVNKFVMLVYDSIAGHWVLGGLNDAGSSGTSGSSGARGASGTHGTSGSSGTSGLTGTSGTSGCTPPGMTSGTSGVRGASGTSGSSGTSGGTGTSGRSGTSGTSATGVTSGTSGVRGAAGSSGCP